MTYKTINVRYPFRVRTIEDTIHLFWLPTAEERGETNMKNCTKNMPHFKVEHEFHRCATTIVVATPNQGD
jgi:hypothetical protein